MWSAWRATLSAPASLPLRHHSIEQRSVLLIRLVQDGVTAWAEASPLPGWSHDTLADNQAALTQLTARTPEQALTDNLPAALSSAVGLLTLPGHELRQPAVRSNTLLLDGGEDTRAADQTADAVVLKVKVGRRPIEADIERLNSLLAATGPHTRLRLDANQSWTLDDVHSLMRAFGDETRIDYVEEPLLPELSYRLWPQQSHLRFAHDERLLATDFVPSPQCAALVLKPTILGWARTCQARQWALQHHKTIIVSSSFESRIGLNQLNNLALYWQLAEPQGLATAEFFDNPWDDSREPILNHLKAVERVL